MGHLSTKPKIRSFAYLHSETPNIFFEKIKNCKLQKINKLEALGILLTSQTPSRALRNMHY
jgi:hypothetical protein